MLADTWLGWWAVYIQPWRLRGTFVPGWNIRCWSQSEMHRFFLRVPHQGGVHRSKKCQKCGTPNLPSKHKTNGTYGTQWISYGVVACFSMCGDCINGRMKWMMHITTKSSSRHLPCSSVNVSSSTEKDAPSITAALPPWWTFPTPVHKPASTPLHTMLHATHIMCNT